MRRRRGLSEEEEALWQGVARTARPLHPPRRLPAGNAAPPARQPAPALPAQGSEPPRAAFRAGAALWQPPLRLDLAPTPAEAMAEAPLRMDRRLFATLRRGRLLPEARLDLHGMTLAEARPALEGFVMRAQGEGRRLVLVITGKGRAGEGAGPQPLRPGALRHAVPLWLAQPPLRAVVLQLAPAHRRHGGAGALYVYLRRRG
jgi:DNA-nicking Smr family endonuclease